MKKSRLKEIIEEEFVNLLTEYVGYKLNFKHKINETLSSSDYKEIKDLIRTEIAAIFFDLFKKKSVWI